MAPNRKLEFFPNSFWFTISSNQLSEVRRRRGQVSSPDLFPLHTNWSSLKSKHLSNTFIRLIVNHTANASGLVYVQLCMKEQADLCHESEKHGSIITEQLSVLGSPVETDAALSKLVIRCSDCQATLIDAVTPRLQIVLPFVTSIDIDLNILTKRCCGTTYQDMSSGYALRQAQTNNVEFQVQLVRVSQGVASDVLKKLLDTSILTDFVLKVDRKELRVHRCVLAASSPVFQRMFEHKELEESIRGNVDIKDFHEEVVEAALRFMYGKEIGNILPSTFMDLLVFAEKYELLDLKDYCEQWLSKDKSIDKILLLELAYKNQAHFLKEVVMQRIVSDPNKKTIWKESSCALELIRSHPELILELLMIM